MNVNVFINGYAVSPADYRVKNGHVVMNQAPAAGDTLEIKTLDGASFISVCNGMGVVYKVYEPDDIRFQDLIKKLNTHKNHPAIQDQLNRLTELLELIQ
jgi:hypothetical protein